MTDTPCLGQVYAINVRFHLSAQLITIYRHIAEGDLFEEKSLPGKKRQREDMNAAHIPAPHPGEPQDH